MSVTFSVPATSANLGPGFDCLGVSLDFRNFFSVTESRTQSIEIRGQGANNTNFSQNNTFVRIFNTTYKNLGGDREFNFVFHNNIPISRGMGSSSAVIIGAVFSAFKIAGITPDKNKILNLAQKYEKHTDNIAPTTFGGFCASFVESPQNVVHIRQSMPNDVRAVMVVPNKPMNTKKTRALLPRTHSLHNCVYNISRSCVLALAFATHKWDLLRQSSIDKLHEEIRMKTYPVLFQVKKTALQNGALMSSLSGSGSSIFSMCYAEDSVKLAKILESRFPKFRILTLKFDNDGVRIEKD